MGTGNVAASYFLGVMFMSSFYSLYLVAFVASVYFSFNVRGRRVRPNKVILSASIVLFIIINVHYVLSLIYNYLAFVEHGVIANGALNFFNSLPVIEVAQLYTYSFAVALMDITLAYRMYIVWGHNWLLTIPPLTCVCIYMALAAVVLRGSVRLVAEKSDLANLVDVIRTAKLLDHEVSIAYALSLFASFYSTSLIIIRVVKNARAMRRAGAQSVVTPAIHLLLESAAACCACLIVTLTTYLLDYAGNWFTLHITPPVIGLSYSAIIIRVGLGIAERSAPSSVPSSAPASLQLANRSRQQTHTLGPASVESYPLKISVTQQVAHMTDGGAPGLSVSARDDLGAQKLQHAWGGAGEAV